MAGSDQNSELEKELANLRRGPTLSEQEAEFRKGRGIMLIGMVSVVVLIVIGAFFLLREDDKKFAYSDIGKKVNGIKQEYFDGFWGCALQGVNIRDIKSNEALVAQIGARSSRGAAVYLRHLRDSCLDKLAQMQTKLDVMMPPDDVSAEVKSMKEATSKLRSAWSAYISYLDDPKTEFDEEIARPKIFEIARGWYDYKKAHAGFNNIIKMNIE
ncbi:MAG: hypothetical protein JXA30_18325 [Deltaproteobacteria bacterium]|nr:hypothetical protein [Deltaproteobacteria bacterium]